MESANSQNFNERLNQWVASQGFWFQMRHPMSGSGVATHLMRLGLRILTILIILTGGVMIYLVKQRDSAAAHAKFEQSLKSGLSATTVVTRGLSYPMSGLKISRLISRGGERTFYNAFEARDVRCRKDLMTLFSPAWDLGVMEMDRLDINLRAGADTADSARKIAEVIFRRDENVTANALQVAHASLRWGFSETTQGFIEESEMSARRVPNGWRIVFRGGLFSQNWLRNMDIVEISVHCSPDRILFEKALLKKGDTTVDFGGLVILAGERPALKGVAKIQHMQLASFLPALAQEYIEGSISGDFNIGGSTNAEEGIVFDGLVTLGDSDTLILRDKLHLLSALTVTDGMHKYRRAHFTQGSFQLKTAGGGMVISDLKLKAQETFDLQGGMKVTRPSITEREDDLKLEAKMQKAIEAQSSSITNPSSYGVKEMEAEYAKTSKIPSDETLVAQKDLILEAKRLEEEHTEKAASSLHFKGSFEVLLRPETFERAEKLKEKWPVKSETGKIHLVVPLDGLLEEITRKEADELYEFGKR